MKRRKVDSHVERRLLMALISSTDFLSQASTIIDLELIEANHWRTIAEWCLDHFTKHHVAPGQDIETTYHSWAEEHEDSPHADAIHDLLEDLSTSWDKDPDPLNVPYLLDQLRLLLNRRRLHKLQEHMDWALASGHPEEAQEAVLGYHPVEATSVVGVDPFRDEEVWERAFSQSSQPLLALPGDAGRFLNHAMTRDALIGIQGPEKRGKTWWCFELVIQALQERRRVAFFQVGDLSEHQALIRLGVHLTGRPYLKSLCKETEIPTKIFPPRKDGDELRVETKITTFKRTVTKGGCLRAVKRFKRSQGMHPDRSYLKVSIHSNSSINVRGIQGILAQWEVSEGFIPDVIVIDYADILAPEDPRQQPRDQVNETWKALRRLSQDQHCLVLVPTQADAASYDVKTQSVKNFSEDKRKLAHVTGMLGLNQTEEEKAMSIMRLNWIVLRESPFSTYKCLWVGQCLPIGRAYFCATL